MPSLIKYVVRLGRFLRIWPKGGPSENMRTSFKRHVYDCIGSCEEAKVWLEFALKCGYLDEESFENLRGKYAGVGAMLSSLVNKWQTF